MNINIHIERADKIVFILDGKCKHSKNSLGNLQALGMNIMAY